LLRDSKIKVVYYLSEKELKHKGHIQVSSENGKGAKFEIFLPIDLD
jgi:signal transduction histidine kinase